MKTKPFMLSLALLLGAGSALAQRTEGARAWELSLGASALVAPQLELFKAEQAPAGYLLSFKERHSLLGLSLGASRELSPHFALRLEQSLHHRQSWLSLTELSLQYQLGAYFNKLAYIDPYFGLGFSYLYTSKPSSSQAESITLEGKPISWQGQSNALWAHRHSLPLSLKAGVKLWLSDRWGIDLSAGYLRSLSHAKGDAWSAKLALSYRLGGASKRPQASVQYHDRYIQTIVEKPIVIERERHLPVSQLLEGIFFDFGSAELAEASAPVLDKLAKALRQSKTQRFLITGYADALGTKPFNDKLSLARARAVASALIARGIAPESIKCRGLGKRTAIAPPTSSESTREQDRKVLLEVIASEDYWATIVE